jgi:hypothetical protein
MKSKEEIKLEFFKQFGDESFRGYPLEQCHAIWDFFEKYIGYTEEDIRKAITFGKGMELWKEEKQIEDYINSLNK